MDNCKLKSFYNEYGVDTAVISDFSFVTFRIFVSALNISLNHGYRPKNVN